MVQRDGVVVTADDGLRLETERLRWQNSDKRLWTDRPVKIVKDGTVVQGRGLSVMMAEDISQLRSWAQLRTRPASKLVGD